MGKEIIQVATSVLRVHPRNSEFFDDISGAEYERFKKSIQDDGLLSPLIVAPDMTVISGHQRLKACKELNYKTIPVIINDDLNEEDIKLKKLIAANFGRLKNDPIKQAKLIKEYEKLCGVRQGSARQKVDRDNRAQPQEHIAKELGISLRQLQDIKRLTTLLPDLQDIISEGRITATTGYKVLAKLSSDEQKKLLESLPETRQFTQKQISEYISKLQEKDNIIAGYEKKLSQNEDEKKNLKIKISELAQTKVKTEVITQQVDKPETLKKIKELEQELANKIEYGKKMYNEMIEKSKLLSTALGDSTNWQLTSHCSEITLKMVNFIKDMAKYDYMAESFNEIPIATRKEYIRCITGVKRWADNILDVINKSESIIEAEIITNNHKEN